MWIHTHPGDCPEPSPTDEETFDRCFGSADWAVMFIIAEGGETYVRQQFNVGPVGEQQMRTEVVFDRAFPPSDIDAWGEEYAECVDAVEPFGVHSTNRVARYFDDVATPSLAADPEVIDEWYLRAEAEELFPECDEEEAWNQYLAAVD